MNASRITDRIEYLDRERLDIKEAIRKASEFEVKRWLRRRLIRNTKTVYALYEVLKDETKSAKV